MNYQTLRKNPAQFLAVTSLLTEEFDWLLSEFAPHWERYYRYHTLEGGIRQFPLYQERGNAKLKGTDTKLFFLLTYLKTNALQQHQAASFGVSQTKVSRLAGVLLSVLNQTLAHLGLVPVRNGEDLAAQLRGHPQKVFCYDGLERGILRNADAEAQADEYSAKKKSHRLKNNLLCEATQRVWFLSATESGRLHDRAADRKKLADEYPLTLPVGSVLRQDTGFVGHQPTGVLVEMPHKKPRNGDLSFSQLLYNQMLAPCRVVIEHANSGIKRLRMVKDTLRVHGAWFRDTVMAVACGLHNLRVASPLRAYLAHERLIEQNHSE